MGNNEIISIQLEVHKRTLEARAFERLVYSTEFVEIYKDGPEIKEILKSGNSDRLKEWIRERRQKDLGEMSYRELRELCKHHHIPRWSRLDTEEMMEALSGIEF